MLTVRTLGSALISTGDVIVTPNSTRKFAFLLYLAAQPGRRLSRSTAQALVFPDRDARNGRHSLRELLYLFRQSGVPIKTDSDSFELPRDSIRSDYLDLIESERPTLDQLKLLEAGFLPGYSPIISEHFSEWLDEFRARTAFDLSKAVLREGDRARTSGDWATTERAARACLAIDPLNEEATLSLAEAMAVGGAKTKALTILDTYIGDVGAASADLRVPASELRRRIGERIPERLSPSRESPFVGREAEMQQLVQCFHSTLTNVPHCVIIGGEAGIGKTRLAAELCTLATLRGARVARMTAQPHDVNRPLAAFVDLVPLLLQLPGALGCSPKAMESLRRLTTHDADFNLPMLTAPEMEALEFAISRAIADVIDAVAAETPLILLVEDAHWLDRPSQQVLGGLISKKQTRRVLVVITTREPRPLAKIFRDVEAVTVMDLQGLRLDSAERLAAWALGDGVAGRRAGVTERIATKCAGNPLFVISLGTHNAAAEGELAIPESLRALLGSRLAKLDDRAMALLQTCASLGPHSTIERVVAALQVPQIDLLGLVTELCDARLLDRDAGDLRLAHPLVAEGLNDKTFAAWRKLAAHRVAQILEVDAERLKSPSLLWHCAEQWRAAANDDRAFAAMRACASQALEMGRLVEAAQMLQTAISLNVSVAERIDVAKELVQTANLADELGLVLEATDFLMALGVEFGHDDVELADIRARLLRLGEDAAVEERALGCAACTSASPEHRVRAALSVLKYAEAAGRTDLMSRIDEALQGVDLGSLRPEIALEFHVVLHSAMGRSSKAVDAARRLRGIVEPGPHPPWQ